MRRIFYENKFNQTLDQNRWVKFLGETSFDEAGNTVAPAGDIDGDGTIDLLIGAHKNSQGGLEAGAAYLVFNTNLLGTITLTPSAGQIIKLVGEALMDYLALVYRVPILSGVWEGNQSDQMPTANTSCGDETSLVLNGEDGSEMTTSLIKGEPFSVETFSQRYTVSFKNGEETCGHLTYQPKHPLEGWRVIWGDKTDTNLGNVIDAGGVITAEDIPSSGEEGFADLDLDGLSDRFSQASEISNVSCALNYIYPYSKGVLFIDRSGHGKIRLGTNSPDLIDVSQFKLLAKNHHLVVDGFSVEAGNYAIGTSPLGNEVHLKVFDLSPYHRYELVMPAGSLVCDDGSSNTENISLPFRAIHIP